MSVKDLTYVFIGKAARVFVFGLVSVMTPFYVATLGYSAFYVGLVSAAIVAGNVFSNLLLTWYESYLGRRRFLLLFSALMLLSGVLLYATSLFPVMLIACFLGNISTTGTEAGPFQSIETGMLPSLVSEEKKNRAFGIYNLIGYGASSLGAFAASTPSYFQNDLLVFRLLFLGYGLVGMLLFLLYLRLRTAEPRSEERRSRRPGLSGVSLEARRDITRLSILYSIDAFGGGFVSQFLLSYWFLFVYHASLETLGLLFLVVNIVTAVSTLAASFLADRIGNLRTMVTTHLVSNVFLFLIPFAGSFPGSVALLLLRQSVSQMDVPTRQAFMSEVFGDRDRVSANAITNTFRSVGSLPGAPLNGILLSIPLVSAPLLIAGSVKIVYDFLIYSGYSKRAT
ncbi:MAG: MFS transporter [Thaumarchaeota archaeon]|nr:MAG: MFS transporter [Nitrososphaerota archaeon]TLY16489.1 MAG: MFS transporter [Nitrososphaerota archaeon]TMP98451.1 MAG: MFS transporter [Nitrososphaerota archaeon]